MPDEKLGLVNTSDEAFTGAPEAWEPWETKLVVWSLVLGVVGLVLLGGLVARFILP